MLLVNYNNIILIIRSSTDFTKLKEYKKSSLNRAAFLYSVSMNYAKSQDISYH